MNSEHLIQGEGEGQRQVPKDMQLSDILKPCSDKISIEILQAIETANTLNIRSTGPYLLEELEIEKKQFYSRIQRLMQQGIIKHGGQATYVLTTFGKIITSNVFRIVNTCVENANELHVLTV
jgi:predicted transcriptional regulator